jgi:serine protease Do
VPATRGREWRGEVPGFYERTTMNRTALLPLVRLVPLAPLSLAGILAAGCSNHVAQAANNVAPADVNTAAPFATPPVLAGTADIATLAGKVKSAVVNVTTTHEMHRTRFSGTPDGFPFNFFGSNSPFGQRGQNGQSGNGGGDDGDQVMKQQALGSGFLVDKQGHVVTNAHVVDDADTVKVKLSDEREYTAKVVGKDPRMDLAVLQLENAKDLPDPVSLGSSDALRLGEYVVAIGNPFGLGGTVTMGIVSAKGRTIGATAYDDFIQTDASINPGNSGGPLFNLRGQVVGINTAINPNGKGIGFAIPVDELKDVLPQLLVTGHVARGRLGVLIQPVDAPLAKALGMDRPRGALIGEVESEGPGAKAGLQAGDVIVAVDDTAVAHSQDLPRIVARHTPGTRVSLKVLRSGHEQAVNVTLDSLKEEKAKADNDNEGESEGTGPGTPGSHRLGIQVSDAPNGGVVVRRVANDSPADGELKPGDVILEVNHSPIAHAADLAAKVTATHKGEPVLLKVRREDRVRFVAIELD